MNALQMSAFGIFFPLRLVEGVKNCLICYKCIIKCIIKKTKNKKTKCEARPN